LRGRKNKIKRSIHATRVTQEWVIFHSLRCGSIKDVTQRVRIGFENVHHLNLNMRNHVGFRSSDFEALHLSNMVDPNNTFFGALESTSIC